MIPPLIRRIRITMRLYPPMRLKLPLLSVTGQDLLLLTRLSIQ